MLFIYLYFSMSIFFCYDNFYREGYNRPDIIMKKIYKEAVIIVCMFIMVTPHDVDLANSFCKY